MTDPIRDRLQERCETALCPDHGEVYQLGCSPCFDGLRMNRDAFAEAAHDWERVANLAAKGKVNVQLFPAKLVRKEPASTAPWRPGGPC